MNPVVRNHRAAILATLAAFAGAASLLSESARTADEGEAYANIVNLPAPKWSVRDWINSPPLTLKTLRGKVVLIRWWTGPDCPYCTPSAKRLNALFHRYKGRGLVVIGFYHHKSETPLRAKDVARLARNMGMDFPVAVDPDWRTLRRYWLDRVEGAPWTSVSFLIDQDGVVRYVHPGGTITEEDAERMDKEISALLEARWRTR